MQFEVGSVTKLLLLVFVAFSAAAANDCIPRYFGDESIVCVCNSTYCDSTPETNLEPGNFLWYTSTKSGSRMKLTRGKIGNTSKASRTITINRKVQFQKLHGFGGAFSDSAGINIRALSNATQENFFSTYFGTDGSRYNLGRVPIGGSDFSTRYYTYDDVNGDVLLKNFSLAFEDRQFKIPLMQRALRKNPEIKFLAAAWTAPPWMKTNNHFAGVGFLKKKYYQVYANYLLKFMDEYKSEGLNIWALSTGNEPSNASNPPTAISAMGWTLNGLPNWVANNLGPSLANSQHNQTIIITIDDQRFRLPWSVDIMFKNHIFKKYISGIAVHWYWDLFYPATILDETHNHLPDKFIIMTEASEGISREETCITYELKFIYVRSFPWQSVKVRLGNWKRAVNYFRRIIENLQHWATGWVDWNLALDKTGGPNFINNPIDSLIIVSPETDEFFKQPLYYALHHFSRFLPRDSVRIGSKDSSLILQSLDSIAFQTPNNEIVVVIFNRSRRFEDIDILDPESGIINLQLAPLSINTIVYSY